MGRLNKLRKKEKKNREGGGQGSGEGGRKGVGFFLTRGTGGGGGKGGEDGAFQDVRGNYKSLKGDKPDGCSKKTSLYIICLVMFTILEGLMLHAVCNPVFRCTR